MAHKIMIAVVVLILLSLVASLVTEIMAGRYLNAVALSGVASVLMWFALQMLQRNVVEDDPGNPDDQEQP